MNAIKTLQQRASEVLEAATEAKLLVDAYANAPDGSDGFDEVATQLALLAHLSTDVATVGLIVSSTERNEKYKGQFDQLARRLKDFGKVGAGGGGPFGS